jgi:uncharacterized protein DUF5132
MILPYKMALKLTLTYFIGIATAPLMGTMVKPLVRGTVRTTIGIGLQVKKLVAEVAEELQDLAAEASVDFAAAETKSGVSVTAPSAETRLGVSATAVKNVQTDRRRG